MWREREAPKQHKGCSFPVKEIATWNNVFGPVLNYFPIVLLNTMTKSNLRAFLQAVGCLPKAVHTLSLLGEP